MLANPDEMPVPYQSCRGTSQEPPPLRPPGATAPVRHAAGLAPAAALHMLPSEGGVRRLWLR